MDLLVLSSVAAGTIVGLSSERASGFAKSVMGGLLIGGAGLLATKVFHKPEFGKVLEWGAGGILLGSTISSVTQRKNALASAPPVAQIPAAPPATTATTSTTDTTSTGDSSAVPSSTASTMGAPTMWLPVQPVGGGYQFQAGGHYRATASVDRKYPRSQIQRYLLPNGWTGVVIYDEGDTIPADWPTENVGALEANRRWVRVDATRSGNALSMPATPGILFITLPIRIANVWQSA